MCLVLRKDSTVPYNKSKFRWKLINFCSQTKNYIAYYRYDTYKKKGWNVARLNGHLTEEGFHVFMTRQIARDYAKLYRYDHLVAKKVQVSGFRRSGTFGNIPSETWTKMKFVKG